MKDMAIKYVQSGIDWLRDEYGTYKSKTTGMEIDEYLSESERDNLIFEILKDKTVHKAYFENNYTLWIEFNK